MAFIRDTPKLLMYEYSNQFNPHAQGWQGTRGVVSMPNGKMKQKHVSIKTEPNKKKREKIVKDWFIDIRREVTLERKRFRRNAQRSGRFFDVPYFEIRCTPASGKNKSPYYAIRVWRPKATKRVGDSKRREMKTFGFDDIASLKAAWANAVDVRAQWEGQSKNTKYILELESNCPTMNDVITYLASKDYDTSRLHEKEINY